MVKDDLLSAIPLLVIICQLLLSPHSAGITSSKAIDNYSINERAVRCIENLSL